MSNKEEKAGLVPRLRFPEFRDAEKWKQKKISAALIERPRPIYTDDEAEYSLVTVKRRYGGVVSRGVFKGKLIKVKTQFFLQENDFLISKRQIVHCACGVVPKALDGSIVSNEYSVLRARDGFDVSFFEYLAQQPEASQSFLRCSIGIVIEKMLFKLNEWLNQEFLFPSLPEQQKIAECLASLDELITSEAQKLDTLKTHKKGLMQQLFPAEGETLPKLRFPEFRDAGEWCKEKLGSVATLCKGKGISKADIDANGVQPCIRYGELYTIYGETITKIASRTNVDASELFLSKRNDVIIPASGETKIDIAKASCVMSDDIALGCDLNVIRSSQNGIFLSYQLNGPLRLSIAKVAQGDTVVHLYPTQIEQLVVLLPRLLEQRRIADCLTSLDDLITAHSQRVAALKNYKMGLMQQLFPVMDA